MPTFAIQCFFTYVKDGEIRVQAEFLLYHFFQLFTVPEQYLLLLLLLSKFGHIVVRDLKLPMYTIDLETAVYYFEGASTF
jgi:hypothetical protein